MAPTIGHPRAADGTARVASLMAFAPQAKLQNLLGEHPDWWHCMADLALEHAFRYGGATGDLLIRDSRKRCIAVLLRLGDCRHADQAQPLTVILSQSDLAAAANLSRQPAGDLLRELAAQGHIDLSYGKVTIRNAAALRKMLDS